MSRCPRSPTSPPGTAEAAKRRTGAGAEKRGLSPASNALLILGQVLDEIETAGGGKVAIVTNEPALAELLSVSRQARAAVLVVVDGLLCVCA